VCSYLGRCEDPDNYYSFPTVENCCHSEGRPFPIEPSYQVSTCLGQDWSSCERYKATLDQGEIEPAAAPSRLQTMAQHPLAARIAVGIVATVVVLIVGLFLILRPSGPAAASPTATQPVERFQTLTASAATETAAAATSLTATASVPAATETATATATRKPTHTPTPTSTHTPTATPSRTPTRTPVPTASRTPTATPTSTTRPTAVPPTKAPTVTVTPMPAPALLAPPNGQEFDEQAEIRLSWEPLGPLPPDAYYVVTLAYSHLGETWYDDPPWVRSTSWLLSERSYLLNLSDDGLFNWSLQVMQQTGTDADGKPTGVPLSLMSDVWTLVWKESGGPKPKPTIEP
jgi:hypothetical protein